MAQQIINNGDAGSAARSKINSNFTELYQGKDAVTVNLFADLPAPATATGQRWWVLQSSGVWLVNRKTKGAYYSDGVDWIYLGDFPQAASEVSFAPTGNIAATNVQAAIAEVETDTTALLSGKANTGAIGSSGLTQGTNRLLGRSTAGTGAVEELTVGSGLTLSGGILTASGTGAVNPVQTFLDGGAGSFFPASIDGGALGVLALTANQIRLFPYSVSVNRTIDQAGVSVSTLAAGSNIRVLIYAADPTTGRPTALLAESASMSGAAAATVFGSLNFTFTEGLVYWIGVYSDAAPVIRTVAVTSTPLLGIGNAASPAYFRLLQKTATFASAPNPWSFLLAEAVNIAVPLVIFRRA